MASVRRFSAEELEDSPVGSGWKRRVRYEIRRTPRVLQRAGVATPPPTPALLRAGHIEQLKRGLPWSPATFAVHFNALRKLLRWAKNPLSEERAVWAVPGELTSRRRWLTAEQLVRLYRASRGRERVLVALEGFNGLRRVEVLRLRSQDVDLGRQRLRVLGKGRNGGKWRTVPMFPETLRVLRARATDAGENPMVMRLSRSGADLVLQRAVRRAGFPSEGVKVSHHDLRRTFGRLAHKAGMDMVQLKNLYGHTSLDQTVHYIGLDEDEMRIGLDRLATFIGPMLLAKPAKVR